MLPATPISNPKSPVLSAVTKRLKSCPQTRASFSTNAKAAKPCSNRFRATAVYIVPTAQLHVHQKRAALVAVKAEPTFWFFLAILVITVANIWCVRPKSGAEIESEL